jgi:hypothetical protein
MVETRSRLGAVPATLLATANELAAQLVAVGTHGPGWVERLFVGSVATTTLRNATCSVLVAPAPDAIDRVRLELGVDGEVTLSDSRDWGAALDAFTHRNMGRRARLSVRDARSDTRYTEAAGYALVGAAYDPHDGRLALMLGEDPARTRRITHTVPDVWSIRIVARQDGRTDDLLVAEHGAGDAVLSFLD